MDVLWYFISVKVDVLWYFVSVKVDVLWYFVSVPPKINISFWKFTFSATVCPKDSIRMRSALDTALMIHVL